MTKLEISAGGIVYKKTPHGYKILFVLDPFGKWTFPKGHVEKGEKIKDAALRETREEAGLKDLRVVLDLGKIDYWFRWKGELVHKLVYFFLIEAPFSAQAMPQKKEGISEVRWVDLDKALEFSSYKDIRRALKKGIEYLKTLGADDEFL